MLVVIAVELALLQLIYVEIAHLYIPCLPIWQVRVYTAVWPLVISLVSVSLHRVEAVTFAVE